MAGWIIAATLVSIVATALLTFWLHRLNAPALGPAKRDGSGGYLAGGDFSRGGSGRNADSGTDDSGSDGGGD